jgi:carbohydrate-binding DOMON domain-containing protein
LTFFNKSLFKARSTLMDGSPDEPIIRLLAMLHRDNVDCIIVGGAAAVLAGAPVVTRDLDIVHQQTPENIERLMTVLSELGAYLLTGNSSLLSMVRRRRED